MTLTQLTSYTSAPYYSHVGTQPNTFQLPIEDGPTGTYPVQLLMTI